MVLTFTGYFPTKNHVQKNGSSKASNLMGQSFSNGWGY